MGCLVHPMKNCLFFSYRILFLSNEEYKKKTTFVVAIIMLLFGHNRNQCFMVGLPVCNSNRNNYHEITSNSNAPVFPYILGVVGGRLKM